MTWTLKANIKGPEGPVGPMGPVNPTSAPADVAVAAWVSTTGTSATQTALDARYAERVSVQRYGAVGDGVADDTAEMQAAFTAATGKTAFVPAGVYNISAGLTLDRNTSLILDPNATIKAIASITGPMLSVGDDTAWWEDKVLTGGHWDCNGLADNAVMVKSALHCLVSDFTWTNPRSHGVIFGSDVTTGPSSHEYQISGLKGNRTVGSASPAGSYGIWLRRAFDSVITDCVVVGPERSFRNDGDANTFIACHAYGLGYNQFPVAVFSENASNTQYIGCYVDTPKQYGWEITANAYRWSIRGGLVFLNGSADDNLVIGIHTALATPNDGTISGVTFNGTVAHRMAKDYDGTFPSTRLSSYGNITGTAVNVVVPVLVDSTPQTFQGRAVSFGSAPAVAAGTAAGTTPPAPVVDAFSTDACGKVTFGTGTAPASGGALVWVTFAKPFTRTPVVQLQPRNIGTQLLGLYVYDMSASSFAVASAVAPAAGAPNTAYAFDYTASA